MSCSNQLYTTLFIVLIFILIFINYKVCKYNKSYKIDKIDIIEGFRNNYVYGTADQNTSKYLFACVDDGGNINQYYVPGDGSMWSNAVNFAENGGNKPSYVREAKENASWAKAAIGGNRDDIPGILCYNDTNSIFKWMGNNEKNNSANSYGTGTNSRQAVINLMPSDITADNFANNNCTKERWYLFKDQSGTNYIYAVFKRNPWTSDLDCCSNNIIQRNSCNDKYTDINSTDCNDYMKEYCRTSNNITKDVCKNWCGISTNSATCKNYQISFCNNGTNFQNNFEFCHTNCDNQKCDIGATNYCKNNLGDNNFCACYLDNAKKNADSSLISTLDDLKLAESDPVCYSSQCRNGNAYQTQSMKDAFNGCPKCLQKMTLANLASADNIKQTCNVGTNNTTTTPAPTTTAPTASAPVIPNLPSQLPTSTPKAAPPVPELTLSDYLDQLTTFLNDIIDSISNLFN